MSLSPSRDKRSDVPPIRTSHTTAARLPCRHLVDTSAVIPSASSTDQIKYQGTAPTGRVSVTSDLSE